VIEEPAISALDLGTALDREGIAVRTGHHCCQPLMERFGISATTRASLALYNTKQDVDALVDALEKIRQARAPRGMVAGSPESASKSAPAIEFPAAVGASPQAVADELADMFELLGDRDARSEYVLELGGKLPHTFEILKKLTPRVPGCMSEVYLLGRGKPGTKDVLEFAADANADIVRGLIAMLQRLFSGQRIADILAFDIEAFFRRIQLDQFISSQRRNGLAGMTQRIRSLATNVKNSPGEQTDSICPPKS
jgi:cysteine desulfurase / selenocysteine lyase